MNGPKQGAENILQRHPCRWSRPAVNANISYHGLLIYCIAKEPYLMDSFCLRIPLLFAFFVGYRAQQKEDLRNDDF